MRRLAIVLLAAAGMAATPAPPGWEISLAPKDEPGAPFLLEGRVVDAGGRPMRDVLVHVYHADRRGNYSDLTGLRLSGVLKTNVLGGFRVRTVLPGRSEGNPHVHFELAGPGPEYRATALNLARAQGAGSDQAYAALPQMVELPAGSWAYVWPDTNHGFRCIWDLPYQRAERLDRRPDAFSRAAH